MFSFVCLFISPTIAGDLCFLFLLGGHKAELSLGEEKMAITDLEVGQIDDGDSAIGDLGSVK